MYKNNLKLILGVLIVLLLAFFLKETDTFAKEAKAAEVPSEAPLPMPTNVSYSTIYYNRHTFVVFSNSTGSDIEVIQIE